jgi:hypothetical protein
MQSMTGRYKTIYLLLTVACFLGIIAIFVFDGYMGVYDTLRMDNGQFVQTITTDQWLQQEEFGSYPSVSLDRGSNMNVSYTVENHRFSAYSADVSVSLYSGVEKLDDLAAGQVTAPAFGAGELSWVLDPSRFIPANSPPEQSYNLALVINRGGVERKVMVYIYPGVSIPKPLPAR